MLTERRVLMRRICLNGAGPVRIRMGGTMPAAMPSKQAANIRGWAK